MEYVENYLALIINQINLVLWSYLLVYLLIAVGLYFTYRLAFIQIRQFRHGLHLIFRSRKRPKGQISSFQAFCTGLGARVGSGNIAGVGMAIYLGGPGAIFWMWVMALLGMATAFVEGVLAQLYKERSRNKTFIGGPAYYIEKGLHSRFWGICFALCLIVAFGLVFNAVQSNTIVVALHGAFHWNKSLLGLILSFVTAWVITGGIVRVSRFSEFVVPFMALFYILIACVVITLNYDQVPQVFFLIFKSAFGLKTVGSGVLGYSFVLAVQNGVKRGLFSNEAGMGSAANAAATASPLPKHPVSQGYIQMFGVFVDTLVICTISALIILLSGVFPSDAGVTGVSLVQVSLAHEIGHSGYDIMAILLMFFAFTSIVANYSYAENNLQYISKKKSVIVLLRVFVILMVLFGSVSQVDLVWNMADTAMGLMALINLVAMLLLSKKVFPVVKDYQEKLKSGSITEFKSQEFEAWKD